jgi:hypothetical protein
LIKPFQLRDALLVSRLQQAGIPLDIEEQLTHPRSPLRSVILNSILYPRRGSSTFILTQQDDNIKQFGLAQMRARPGQPENDVVFISPSLESKNGSHAIWQRLLTHLCIQTAERGRLRIYAQLPMQSEELQLFKNVGFLEYGQKNIFSLKQYSRRAATPTAIKLRLQKQGDGWGLQKLYATLAPRAVQNAEGLAQGQWGIAKNKWGEQGHHTGYVWEVDGEIAAALHLKTGKKGYLIRTLLHPDVINEAEELGLAALNLTTARPHLPVYFAYRQYEAGWSNVLPRLNFEPFTSQTLLVKHLTVRMRDTSPALIRAWKKALPKDSSTAFPEPPAVKFEPRE